MKVYIDPLTDVDYSAYYIKGLYDAFGRHTVTFNAHHFRELNDTKKFRFVTIQDKTIGKYIVDWGDDHLIDESDYNWCDQYGKINYNPEKTPVVHREKIVSMAPGFGVQVWGKYRSAYYSLVNLISEISHVIAVKKFMAKYYKQYKHLPLGCYEPYEPNLNYVYSVNTLWNSDEWINNDDTVNQYRANFINVCKALSIVNFEGGFVYSHIKNDNQRFEDLIIEAPWIPKKTYIQKIKESTLVFNTPAWALCHGWKLGEYLAMGKAIISTPLLNALPSPLEHGKHIHIVSGEEDAIKDAVELIISDKEYRNHLEKNAYDYYLKYVSPIQSIKLLVTQ